MRGRARAWRTSQRRLGGLATNLAFNVVEFSDPWIASPAMAEAVGHMNVIELAPCMSPACGFMILPPS